eukprot:757305-Hanusia_phi.AAC.1
MCLPLPPFHTWRVRGSTARVQGRTSQTTRRREGGREWERVGKREREREREEGQKQQEEQGEKMTREEMKTTGTFTVIFLGLPLIFAAPFVQSSLPASLSRIQCTAISSVYPKIQWPVLKLRGGGPKEEPLLCRLKKGTVLVDS